MSRFIRLFLSFCVLWAGTSHPSWAEADLVYKRVIESKTIRCGYAQWPPFFTSDPNTKEFQGLSKDLMEKIGAALGLKVEWTTEIGWGEVTEAIKSNKFDVFCVGVHPSAARRRLMTLSRPMLYNPMYLWARAGDYRFDHHHDLANNPSITITETEGSSVSESADVYFPKAKKFLIASNAPEGDNFINIISKKADLTIYNTETVHIFLKNNPGELRQVKGPPVFLAPLSIPLAQGEYQLKGMIDAVLTDFINDGTITTLIKKYNAKETYAPQPDVLIP